MSFKLCTRRFVLQRGCIWVESRLPAGVDVSVVYATPPHEVACVYLTDMHEHALVDLSARQFDLPERAVLTLYMR